MSRLPRTVLAVLFCGPALVAAGGTQNGMALLSMCKGADRVRTLSVMCHSYLNGYLDAREFQGGRPDYCLGPDDRTRVPQAVVAWFERHPEQLKQPAARALHDLLAAEFPCVRK